MKQIIRTAIYLDEDTLFNEVNSVINYLHKIKAQYKNGERLYLNQEWSGYEDNYFEIVVERLETDAEEKARLEKEEAEWREAEKKRKEDFAEQKRKEGIQQQIDNLKKQL